MSKVVWDLESAFNLGGYFGPTYDVNIAKVIQKGYVLGFAWKYVGKPRIYTCYIWDFPLYKKDPRNDINVIKKWIEVMSDPKLDLAIGQNSDSFDNKVMYGRLLIHNLPPLAMPATADTKKMVKRIARYDSNKLDDLAEQFGYGKKIKTDIDLWWDCMMGVKKAQKQMETYNKRDVEITEKVYLHLLPHSLNHPNMANLLDKPDACIRCGKNEGFSKGGFKYKTTGKYQRWNCLAKKPDGSLCWAYNTDRLPLKTVRPNHV
jgi:hypothetical protein